MSGFTPRAVLYDDVIPPLDRDRELMGNLPDLENEYKTRFGVKNFIKGIKAGWS